MSGPTRYRTNPAITFLLRAFAPGCPTMLSSWSRKRQGRGARITIAYHLPDDQARRRADELVRTAGSLHQVAIGRRVITAACATVDGDMLNVDVLLHYASGWRP